MMINPSFFNIPPRQFALLSALLGLLLIDDLDFDEQNSLGNFLVSIGQVLMASSAQGSLQQNKAQAENEKDNIKQQIKKLKDQICDLEKGID